MTIEILDNVQEALMIAHKENNMLVNIKTKPDTARGTPSLSMIGLLVMQMIIGYEWLLSGIAKIARGDFSSGLSDNLAEMSAGAAGWYAGFLNSVVIPNATAFGYLIEIAEVLAGLALIVGPLIWIFAWSRVSDDLRVTVIALMIGASIGGIFMALNFHVASAVNHPWVRPDSGFDEGVDVDLLLSGIQIAIVAVQIFALNSLRRERTDVVAATSQVKQLA